MLPPSGRGVTPARAPTLFPPRSLTNLKNQTLQSRMEDESREPAMDSFTSVNPARPTEVIGRWTISSPDAVDAAVNRAATAQHQWTRVPVPARGEIIDRCGRLL